MGVADRRTVADMRDQESAIPRKLGRDGGRATSPSRLDAKCARTERSFPIAECRRTSDQRCRVHPELDARRVKERRRHRRELKRGSELPRHIGPGVVRSRLTRLVAEREPDDERKLAKLTSAQK